MKTITKKIRHVLNSLAKGLQKLTFYDKITFKKDYFWHSQIFFSYNNTKAMYHYM